jgi:hypothetical protein
MPLPSRHIALLAAALLSFVAAVPTAFAADAEPIKVLYITHIPGKYHNYKIQGKLFQKNLVQRANVKITYQGTNDKETLAFLNKKDFAKGYDVIVYNLCYAANGDLEMIQNIIDQTEKLGVPAVMVHCAMHCFWPTSPKKTKAEKLKKSQDEWAKKHPDKPFPTWWKFLGLHTVRHDHASKVHWKRPAVVHPIAKSLPAEWSTPTDELYQNIEFPATSTAVLTAISSHGHPKGKNHPHAIAWTRLAGPKKARLFGTTIGHSTATWKESIFHDLLANGILWAADKLDEEGKPKEGYGPKK